MEKPMKILIIIPAYNEQENIENVIIHLSQTVPEAHYVVIDDCSTDHTQEICRRNGFRYVSLPVNLGIGGGVQTGYLYAKEHDYDIAVQMDGDGQHDPKYLKAVIEPLCNNEADMAIGSRFLEKEGFQSSAMRRLGIKIIHGIIRLLCRADIKDPTSGFRATNKELTAFFQKTMHRIILNLRQSLQRNYQVSALKRFQ